MSLLGFNAVGRLALGQIGQPQNANPAIAQASGTGVARGVVATVATGITQAAGVGVAGGVAGDPYFANVVLLLGFEGTNGSTGAPGMTDESPAAHGAGTVNFDAAISTTHSAFGSSSLQLGTGGSGKAQVQWPTSTDWDFGSGPFTIEVFYIPGTINGGSQPQHILRGHNWDLLFFGTNLRFTCTDGSSTVTLTDPTTYTAAVGLPTYVCVDFDGTTYRLYNSFSIPTATAAKVASSASVLTIATASSVLQLGSTAGTIGDAYPSGWFDEVRITKGVARYATDSSFTVPTSAFPRSAGSAIIPILPAVSVPVAQAAGTGRAGTVLGQSTAPSVVGVAGTGVAGGINLRTPAVPGVAGTGTAGTITVVVSGGGVSKKLIEDRPRNKRRKTGLEPIDKRFDPPLPIETPKLPLPPFSDAPAIAPEITEPGELRELVPRGLLSLQDEIFNAQDTSDIDRFLRGIDQDDQDAADIADVLAHLDD